jgi:hypothetical protein
VETRRLLETISHFSQISEEAKIKSPKQHQELTPTPQQSQNWRKNGKQMTRQSRKRRLRRCTLRRERKAQIKSEERDENAKNKPTTKQHKK